MPRTASTIRELARTSRTPQVPPESIRAATTWIADRARAHFEAIIDERLQHHAAPYGDGPGGRRHVVTVPLLDVARDFLSGNEPELEADVKRTMADPIASRALLTAVKAKLEEGGFKVEIGADADEPGVWRAFVSDPHYVREFFPEEAFDHGEPAFSLQGKWELKAFGHQVARIKVKKGDVLAIKSSVDAREDGRYRLKVWTYTKTNQTHETLDVEIPKTPKNTLARDALPSAPTRFWVAHEDNEAIIQLVTPSFEKGTITAPDRVMIEVRRLAGED